MNDNVRYGIIGILSVLLGAGSMLYLHPGETNHTFYCNATGEVGVFYGGISTTGLRAYPYTTNQTGYKDCTNRTSGVKSVWVGCNKVPGFACTETPPITTKETYCYYDDVTGCFGNQDVQLCNFTARPTNTMKVQNWTTYTMNMSMYVAELSISNDTIINLTSTTEENRATHPGAVFT